eukprot:10727580-Heterocapsa_arctica.AAC.1
MAAIGKRGIASIKESRFDSFIKVAQSTSEVPCSNRDVECALAPGEDVGGLGVNDVAVGHPVGR